jgi:hypothetical protein
MGEALLQQEGGEYNEVLVGTRLLIGFLCLQAPVIRGEQLGYKRPKQFGHTLYIQVGRSVESSVESSEARIVSTRYSTIEEHNSHQSGGNAVYPALSS